MVRSASEESKAMKWGGAEWGHSRQFYMCVQGVKEWITERVISEHKIGRNKPRRYLGEEHSAEAMKRKRVQRP